MGYYDSWYGWKVGGIMTPKQFAKRIRKNKAQRRARKITRRCNNNGSQYKTK
jgi:hypothetical protein